ncbi:9347_t:CDS:2, partial [Racocetra persica]
GSHLNPILEICKILEDRGYKITLAAPGNFTAKSTLYHSIPQIITGEPPYTYSSPEFKEIFFNKYTFKSLADGRMKTNKRYIEYFNKYLQAYKETKADLFFCDYVANEACFDLAWKLKKPVVGFVSSTMCTYDLLFFFTPPPPFKSDPMMDFGIFKKNLDYINSQRAEVGVDKHSDFRGRIINTLFLVDNFFGFEVPSAWPPIHQDIGPVLPDTFFKFIF